MNPPARGRRSQDRTADPAAEDRALMERLRQRDAAALGALYERHGGQVLAICMRIVGNAADAEEVLEQVYWELWSQAERYEPSRGSPIAYLLTLARSRAIDRVRARRRRLDLWVSVGPPAALEGLAISEEGGPLEDALSQERRHRIRKLLLDLSDSQRTVVELSFFRGLTHTEIARQLDLPIGTVKTRIRSGLTRLRAALRELDEELR